MNRATAMIGSENSNRKATTVVIQTKTGIRSRRIPLALMLNTVTRKFTADTSEARPRIWRPKRPVVHGGARRVERPGIGLVAEPPPVGRVGEEVEAPRPSAQRQVATDPVGAYGGQRGAEEEGGVEEDPTEEEDPPGEGIEPGEGNVPGPDHQRQQVVHEGGTCGHHEEEDHRRAVHGEQGVVGPGGEELAVGLGELDPEEKGLYAADDEEGEGGIAIHDPDLLVVDRGDP